MQSVLKSCRSYDNEARVCSLTSSQDWVNVATFLSAPMCPDNWLKPCSQLQATPPRNPWAHFCLCHLYAVHFCSSS